MSYRKIHKVILEGTAIDVETIYRLRSELELQLVEQQRELGRIQLLDITPLWDTKYDEETEHFNYKLVMHFVFVGYRKCLTAYGELGGNIVGL
jgi:hypothetical protein